MKVDELDFWADYELDYASAGKDEVDYQFCYQREDVSAAEGLTLEVTSSLKEYALLTFSPTDGEQWTGRFEPGVEGISAAFATPSENTCCVVVKGQAYWVPVTAPADYQTVPSFPVKKVLAIPGEPLMIFVDYVRLVAYGSDGIAWLTSDLSWDGIEISEVTSKHIKGKAWDAPNNQYVEFTVDVNDGVCRGGSSPDLHACQSHDKSH